MKKMGHAFRDLVEQRIELLKTTPFALEQAYNLPPDAIRNVIRSTKEDGPTLSRAKQVADALGLEFYIGPKREFSGVPSITVDASEFAPIPEHTARLAAGGGEINDDDCVVGHLVFRKDWLDRHGIQPEKAILAHASGNSMAPCIMDGDLLLIDTRGRDEDIPVRAIKPGKPLPIYAFQADGEARVKRIARPTTDQILILSDNPEFPPEIVSGNRLRAMNIIGRVRWWGHTVTV